MALFLSKSFVPFRSASFGSFGRLFSSSSGVEKVSLQNERLFREETLINGEWRRGDHTFQVFNPANGNLLGVVPDMDGQDASDAIDAAQDAFHSWSTSHPKQRSTILRKWYDLTMENQEDLARLLTAEQGKTLAEARGEIAYGAAYLEYYSEEAKRINGEILVPPAHNRRSLILKQPIGVCSMITPWNFPSAMISRKVAPALAAGCTAVIKPAEDTPHSAIAMCELAQPAEDTPYSAIAMCELAQEAGVPPGVLNLVTCSRDNVESVGSQLATNPIVRKISFTGSTGVGKHLMSLSASTVKKVSMELGGNAPFIVFDDADLDKAVAGAIASKFRNSGQTCVCSNRFYIQSNIYDAFVEKFSQAVKDLKVGNGMENDIQQGPLINLRAIEKTEQLVNKAIEDGASAVVGGHRHPIGANFFEPTILVDIDSSMQVCQEEIFAPIAPLQKFETEEEVIKLANDTRAGLIGYVYSKDTSRVWRVMESLEYGMVGVNEGVVSSELAPFGGWKESGLGREGSQHGINEYLQTKYVCMSLN